jgi:predicted esterase YcpF (UPF0227 family)
MQKKILYIHGFASAGSSGTATQLRNHFYPKGVAVISPDVPLKPLDAIAFLKELVLKEQPVLVVGTSMGALYAEQLRGIPRILVNPSFHMARSLTFKGFGKREFFNKRLDGAKTFMVDKQMVEEFRQLEKNSFQGITDEEKALVYGLFGTQDKTVNCQSDYKNNYGDAHFQLFEGEHRLNGHILDKVVVPLIETII